jgi:hypothetical protein
MDELVIRWGHQYTIVMAAAVCCGGFYSSKFETFVLRHGLQAPFATTHMQHRREL